MEYITITVIALVFLFLGIIGGFLIHKKIITKAKNSAENIIKNAEQESEKIIIETKNQNRETKKEILQRERLLLKQSNLIEKKEEKLELRQEEFKKRVIRLKEIKSEIEAKEKETILKLEKAAGLSKEEAKEALFKEIEEEYSADLLSKIQKLEEEGNERFDLKAKRILSFAVQKNCLNYVQDYTTTVFNLPDDDVKGKIIGKEGRNIKTIEKLTGVEIIIDETPGILVISSFDPIRRKIASIALEKLIQDGRIQPAKIEEKVVEAEKEIDKKIKQAGDAAVYDLGILGFPEKLIKILGKLYFRTSYGQNILSHSIEVALLASALADEIGVDADLCKKAGLLHDIGKAFSSEVEGSHVDIGIKVLEKFNIDKKIITAMKSHHEEYPYESTEAILIQVADQISAARPGARKDTIENYLKRLKELESLVKTFKGIDKVYAVQAGREIRVFVNPENVNDLEAKQLAKEIAIKIQNELKYPGELKVNLIRETRVIEYAR